MKSYKLITSILILPLLASCRVEGSPVNKTERDVEFEAYSKENEVTEDVFLEKYQAKIDEIVVPQTSDANHFSFRGFSQDYFFSPSKFEWALVENDIDTDFALSTVDKRFFIDDEKRATHNYYINNWLYQRELNGSNDDKYGEVATKDEETGYIYSDVNHKTKQFIKSSNPEADLKNSFRNSLSSKISPISKDTIKQMAAMYSPSFYIDNENLFTMAYSITDQKNETTKMNTVSSGVMKLQVKFEEHRYVAKELLSYKVDTTFNADTYVRPLLFNEVNSSFYAKKDDTMTQEYTEIKELLFEVDPNLQVEQIDVSSFWEVN